MVQIGIEASTNLELQELNKNQSLDKVAQAVKLLREHDIVAQGLIIVGTRNDSADSIIQKVHYMQRLDVDFPIFTMFTPFPGSDVYNEAKVNNWLETEDYSLYDMSNAIMPTKHLTSKQLMASYRWCYASYYMNVWKLIKGLLSKNDWKRKIWRHMLKFSLKQMVRTWTRF